MVAIGGLVFNIGTWRRGDVLTDRGVPFVPGAIVSALVATAPVNKEAARRWTCLRRCSA
ncbi:MAG: hypothetical protein ACLUEQ_02755 [Cloacibacillus evryensis]